MPAGPNVGTSARGDRDGPGRLTKALVVASLILFVGLAVGRVEAWPFTAWRLFSERRGPVSTGYRAYAVSPAGEERRVGLGSLPLAYRQAGRLLLKFPRYDEREREGICEAIAEGARADGLRPSEIRIYRVVERSRIEDGEPVKALARELRFSCDATAGPQ
jgi:hypothetical protein